MLGLFEGLQPRFVKRFAEAGKIIHAALAAYRDEVENGRFPDEQHAYEMPAGEIEKLNDIIKNAEAQ